MRIEIDETCYVRTYPDGVVRVSARARDPRQQLRNAERERDLRQQLRNAERERDALQVEAASKSVPRDRYIGLVDDFARAQHLVGTLRTELEEERLHPESRRVLKNELLRLQRELDTEKQYGIAATRRADGLAEERNEFRNALDAAHKAMRKALGTLELQLRLEAEQ